MAMTNDGRVGVDWGLHADPGCSSKFLGRRPRGRNGKPTPRTKANIPPLPAQNLRRGQMKNVRIGASLCPNAVEDLRATSFSPRAAEGNAAAVTV